MCKWGTVPDYVTFATLLSGCNEMVMISQVHSHVVRLGFGLTVIVCNSLVDAYCKSGSVEMGGRVFGEMGVKDSVTFNAMISGYSNVGMSNQAIKLFKEMQRAGVMASEFTYAAVICASMGMNDVPLGQQFHALVVKANFVWNVFVSNAFLDFYSKHDSIDDAKRLFDEMSLLDCVSYNVIITGFVWAGKVKEALELFRELQWTNFDRKQFPFATIQAFMFKKTRVI